jgi:hypothetical protein
MITPVKSPFDLPAIKSNFFVEVPPLAAALMERSDEEGGSLAERQAIWQIYGLIEKDAQGFNLPHQYGLSYPERKLTQASQDAQLNFQLRSLELVERIAKETGVDKEAIGQMAAEDPQSFAADERFTAYTPALLQLQAASNQGIDHGRAVTTAYMRLRLKLSEWTLEHSEALHDLIYSQILEFYYEEERLATEAGKQIKAKKNPQKIA